MTQSEILSQLKPCPFCGAGETSARVDTRAPLLQGGGDITLVTIEHMCPLNIGARYIRMTSRTPELAISQWNARAGGEKA